MTTYLVTGTNRGIGLELVRQLEGRGADVIAVCREASKELTATGATILSGFDVAAPDAPAHVAQRLGTTKLDVLVHNAGILIGDSLTSFEDQAIRDQIEVNALAPLRLTRALLPHLAAGAKIAIVTSRMGSLADNGSGGYYGYRMSKAAVNMAGVSLARDLAPHGIAVALIHPGYVRTRMTGMNGDTDPADAARGILARIDALDVQSSGSFWHQNGQTLPF